MYPSFLKKIFKLTQCGQDPVSTQRRHMVSYLEKWGSFLQDSKPDWGDEGFGHWPISHFGTQIFNYIGWLSGHGMLKWAYLFPTNPVYSVEQASSLSPSIERLYKSWLLFVLMHQAADKINHPLFSPWRWYWRECFFQRLTCSAGGLQKCIWEECMCQWVTEYNVKRFWVFWNT